MIAAAQLVPLDAEADDSADANRARALEFLRRKLATASGPYKRGLLRELQMVEAGGLDNSGHSPNG